MLEFLAWLAPFDRSSQQAHKPICFKTNGELFAAKDVTTVEIY
jgi:hypothetical protein